MKTVSLTRTNLTALLVTVAETRNTFEELSPQLTKQQRAAVEATVAASERAAQAVADEVEMDLVPSE